MFFEKYVSNYVVETTEWDQLPEGQSVEINLNPTGLSQIWLTLLQKQNAPKGLK